MRARDLDLRELLEFHPKGGVLRFASDRAVLLNTAALGLLRRELVGTLGIAAARAVLTRFGFAHGWRTAEALRTTYDWDSTREWQLAGGRLHQLQGFLRYEPVPRPKGAAPRHFAEAVWYDSYEAQEHLTHVGAADEPVCWTLCGFASGYLSCSHGRDIYCIEEKCQARGDACCLMAGRPVEQWDDSVKAQLAYFNRECLDEALRQVTDLLKLTERRLTVRRRELARVQVEEQQTGIVAQSATMQRVLDQARRVSRVDSTVLISGESGAGKEAVARLVHDESGRAAHAFVAVNCAAVPEALMESELFGHARGAFTGAAQDRVGLFEAANHGTLLLDEVGDLPPSMQAKLLRVLQDREVRRVGENRSRRVDVRVLAATHRDLAAEVTEGRFRQDLFYRLRVIEIHIPPLRDRRDDILPLARRFLAETSRRLQRPVNAFTPRAADLLLKWHWPGNVRELQNVVERAVVLAQERRVEVEDLPEEVRATSGVDRGGNPLRLAEVERAHILRVLEDTGGNRTKAAALLGIGVATLFRRLKEMGDAAPTVAGQPSVTG